MNQLTVSSSGTHLVEFRSTDKAANTEETKSVTFKVQLPVCDRSDEFDGTDDLLAALAAARPQRRHAHHGRAGADADRHRPAAPADERPRDRRGRRDVRARPDQLHRPGPRRAGQRLAGGDAVHRPLHGRLAERRPGRLAGGRQLLPLHADPQPQSGGEPLRRAVQGQPRRQRPRARASPAAATQRSLPNNAEAGHDQDALHARRRRQQRRRRSTRSSPRRSTRNADWVNFPATRPGTRRRPRAQPERRRAP